MPSSAPTPWAVICEGPWDLPGYGCGKVFLTEAEYRAQMYAPNRTWRCPNCRYEAEWDDANYEAWIDAQGITRREEY